MTGNRGSMTQYYAAAKATLLTVQGPVLWFDVANNSREETAGTPPNPFRVARSDGDFYSFFAKGQKNE